MPHDFRHMTLKMKWNDIQARTGEIWLHQPDEQNPAVLIMVVAGTAALDA
jgi:hypothetical protein